MKKISAQILGPDFQFRHQTVEIEHGMIQALTLPTSQEDSCGVVSYVGLKMIPGLIDVHMHGYHGISCHSDQPDDFLHMGRYLAKEGVTGYAAGIFTTSDEKAVAAVRACRLAAEKQMPAQGAQLLGIHMEGPFLNPLKKGAMNEKYIQRPDAKTLDAYLQDAGKLPLLMTLAPEMEGAQELIRYAQERGVQLSMGHTFASYEEALRAVRWGVKRATHTFNAMRPLQHRESGVLGAVLLEDEVQCEMIADFVHLKPEICQMIYRLKGADRITLISDSCDLAGLSQKELPAESQIVLKDAAYLPNGTLCGSISTVMTAVRNLVSIGIPLEEAVKMASYNPARDLELQDQVGSIEVGKKANLVLVDDALTVQAVYVEGERVL